MQPPIHCECGYAYLAQICSKCPSCGRRASGEAAKRARDEIPFAMLDTSAEEPTIDVKKILDRATRDVLALRRTEAILGVILLFFAGLVYLAGPDSWSRDPSVATSLVVASLAMGVSGIVNLVLAGLLRAGAHQIARAHRALSIFGLAVGGIALLLLLGGVWDISLVVRGVLSVPLVGILLIPTRALILLSRSDVKAYLAVGMLPTPETLSRELVRDDRLMAIFSTAGKHSAGAGMGLAAGVVGLISLLSFLWPLIFIVLLFMAMARPGARWG